MPVLPIKKPRISNTLVYSLLHKLTAVCIVVSIVFTGVLITQQVHSYRASFSASNALRVQEQKLNTEWHKILLEQQTHSATTNINKRAIQKFGMRTPKQSNIYTLTLPKTKP